MKSAISVNYNFFLLPNRGKIFWKNGYKNLANLMYQPNGRLGKVYKFFLKFWMPKNFDNQVFENIDLRISRNFDYCAGYLSPPGHWQKIVLIVTGFDKYIVLKIPLTTGAQGRILNELKFLEILNSNKNIRSSIPIIFNKENNKYIFNSLLATEYISSNFPNRNIDYLAKKVISAISVEYIKNYNSIEQVPVYVEAVLFYSKNKIILPTGWAEIIRESLQKIKILCYGKIIKTTIAHRDFAPWNIIKKDEEKIIVTDWEYAAFGRTFSHDLIAYEVFKLMSKYKSNNKATFHILGSPELSGYSDCEKILYFLDTAVQYLDYYLDGGDKFECRLLAICKISLTYLLKNSKDKS